MTDSYQGFDARVKNIGRKRARLSKGYVSQITDDGLIVFRPKKRKFEFPLRGLTFVVIGFLVLKGVILAHVGTPLYQERVAALRDGMLVERVGAMVMQLDPVSESIGGKLRPFLR
ncbi:hypothetical protein [Roseovarius sp. SYSU LYC5161]|uniref:hypothetical protein n=1 Tax=Roseovarius halophilus (ex Wu et al. 2025) TaxID=3376060 RepID=UPI00399BFC12